VATITYNAIGSHQLISWQLTVRYNKFKELYDITNKHLKHGNISVPFPLSSITHSIFGIDDNLRNERMHKFDAWLRELTANPVAMTTKEILSAVYRILEIDTRAGLA
jgi:hypothetical protein